MNHRSWLLGSLLGLGAVFHPGLVLPGGGGPVPEESVPLLEREACAEGADESCPEDADGAALLPAGARAEPFVLPDPEGAAVVFEADGSPTLLVFWSMFCPPCREELPHLADASERYASRDLRVVSVNLDGTGLARAVARYAALNGVAFPVAVDERVDGRFAVAGAYGVTGTPSIFLVDRRGVVRWSHEGRAPPRVLEDLLESLPPQ